MENEKENYDYNALVKKRLFKWRREFEQALGEQTLNYSGIADMMYQKFHIKTSPSKIRAMLDGEPHREVKLSELVALAQLFNIPLWSICEFPESTKENDDSGVDFSRLIKGGKHKDSAIHQLTNHYYNSDYYCYYFDTHPKEHLVRPVKNDKIEEAKMTIDIKEGRTIVTLEKTPSNTTFCGDPVPPFKLTGELNLLENPSMAYSFITGKDGHRAMALMFRYFNLSYDIRYYIPVGMLTFSIDEIHEPLFQKMAVFRVRQDYNNPKTADMLRGILSLNSAPLVIDNDTLTELRKDKRMERILSPDKAIFNHCSVFLESSIRSNSYFIPDENERMQLLLQIRSNSLYPSHEIISEPKYFNRFIKHHQMNQPEHAEFVKDFKQKLKESQKKK